MREADYFKESSIGQKQKWVLIWNFFVSLSSSLLFPLLRFWKVESFIGNWRFLSFSQYFFLLSNAPIHFNNHYLHFLCSLDLFPKIFTTYLVVLPVLAKIATYKRKNDPALPFTSSRNEEYFDKISHWYLQIHFPSLSKRRNLPLSRRKQEAPTTPQQECKT